MGALMNLNDIRKKLDKIDYQIIKLLDSRMELALKSKKFKQSVEDVKREQEIFEKIKNQSGGLIDSTFCENLYKEIITESKKLQSTDYRLIAFQGEHGAYSEVASRVWDESLIPIPCSEFTEIFEEVESGVYDFGIVPVENNTGGVVTQVNQLILNTKLNVTIENCTLFIPIPRLWSSAGNLSPAINYSRFPITILLVLQKCWRILLQLPPPLLPAN
jgi:chorismate mutase